MSTDNEKVEEAQRLIQSGDREAGAQIYDDLGLHTVADIVRKGDSDKEKEEDE